MQSRCYPALVVLLHVFLTKAAPSAANLTFNQGKASDISWGPCPVDFERQRKYNTTIDCGELTVPLDYLNQTSSTLQLQLLRARATKSPPRGSVLFNYGGPGEDGRASLVRSLPWMSTLTGFVHDLIAFDPRGTVDTIPMVCYNATEGPGNIQTNSNASDTANGEIWVAAGNIAEACYERKSSIGRYMGTATAARDLISVADALKEDGMLRFHGISYGSVLGATVAAMFPDRVDKMYLDGIANAHEYYHSIGLEAFAGTDKLWSEFFVGCVAAPSACPLARSGKTAQKLEDEFYAWLYHLKEEPLILSITGIQTFTSAKSFLLGYIYSPASWPNISQILDAAQQANVTLLSQLVAALPPPIIAAVPAESERGIECSDKIPRITNLHDWLPQAAKIQSASRLIGDSFVYGSATCARWKMPAVEIYQGDFQVKTPRPILFASNEYDPVTPLVSAKNMSSGFKESFLLVNKNGHGHTTRRQPSACMLRTVSNYFLTGNLPAAGTFCKPSVPLFGNVTEAEVLAMVSSSA